jgi:hypothetical protein
VRSRGGEGGGGSGGAEGQNERGWGGYGMGEGGGGGYFSRSQHTNVSHSYCLLRSAVTNSTYSALCPLIAVCTVMTTGVVLVPPMVCFPTTWRWSMAILSPQMIARLRL